MCYVWQTGARSYRFINSLENRFIEAGLLFIICNKIVSYCIALFSINIGTSKLVC